MIKETGIIMSGNHPKLIIDGRKTMTRRVIPKDKVTKNACASIIRGGELGFTKCPYGQVGDRLWVRETFEYIDRTIIFDAVKIRYCSDGQEVWSPTKEKWAYQGIKFKKMPSLFMPRWASRLTLEITGVRVERLQEITEEDAKAESPPFPWDVPEPERNYRYAFLELWNSLNAKRGYGWDKDPWVWVISFKEVKDS